MGILDLFDPTRDWPEVAGSAPDVSSSSLQLRVLPFGSPIEAARFLGRPDEVTWRSRIKKDCNLLYARKGFRLRFMESKLSEVAYLIGPGACSHLSFQPSQPVAPDGTALTAELDRDRIIALFGEPDPGGSDETVLQIFHGNGVISDFFLDDQGHLQEWALYPDD